MENAYRARKIKNRKKSLQFHTIAKKKKKKRKKERKNKKNKTIK